MPAAKRSERASTCSPRCLFRRHVIGCSKKNAGACGTRGIETARQAEIGYTDLILGIDQDVVGFQIAMDDVFGMRGSEPFAELAKDGHGVGGMSLRTRLRRSPKSSPSNHSMVMKRRPSATPKS